jgi:HEAT repeat protein
MKSVRSLLPVAAALAVLCGAALGQEPAATFDELLQKAVRYGDTAEKRAEKAKARAELFAGGPAALDGVMARIHIENVMISVLAQELVEKMDAAAAVPVLLAHTKAERSVTRKMAAYFLGFYEAPAQAKALIPLLADEETRGAAIRTLGKWRVADAVPQIRNHIRDSDERVRVQVVNALRDIGDPRGIPALIETLDDPVFTVRNAAGRALVTMGSASVGPLLAALPEAREPALRQIIRYLGMLGSPKALDPLKGFLKHPDKLVRSDAAASLKMISPEKAVSWLRGVDIEYIFTEAEIR